MSIQPAKISNEDDSLSARQSPGYVERAVRWFAGRILHVRLPNSEQLETQDLIKRINKKMVCPTVLLRQFERRLAPSHRGRIYAELGKKEPISLAGRIWNRVFASEAKILRRHYLMGKSMARKNPYLIAPAMVNALLHPDDWQSCRCINSSLEDHHSNSSVSSSSSSSPSSSSSSS